MHFYKFHIGDYKTHTSHLSPMEDLCYRRMIDWCCLHEKPFPDDASLIARFIGLNDCSTHVQQVLNEFFTLDEHGWKNKRVLEEIDAYYNQKTNASNAGKASAEARKKQAFNERSTTVQPTINHKPLTNIYTDDFEKFWNIYPKRNSPHNKQAALKAWNARLKDGDSPEQIIRGAKNYADECDRNGRTGTEFVKQASTFIGPNKHYNDYQSATVKTRSHAGYSDMRDYT